MAARYGRDGGRARVRAIAAEYSRIIAGRPSWAEENRALRFHLRQSIGPNLAAYRVLSREHGDALVARRTVRDLMEAQMTPILRVAGVIDRLGVTFAGLRRATRWLVPRAFPAPGFTVGWGQDDDEGLRFDVSVCFYLRLLRHYGAPELTSVFCYGDQLVCDRMPRTLTLARTGTLAVGAPRCDFLLQPVDRSGR